jgi:hypothetical protein
MGTIIRVILLLSILISPCLAAEGDITAVRILGSDIGNGWEAEIDITDGATLDVGGTYAFGLGTNNDPTTAKVVFTVTSLGFDDTGDNTTIARTVYGTKQVRKRYPNQTDNNETTDGSTITVTIALSDFIYARDTTTVAIASGLYTVGAKTSAQYTGTPTNSSTLAYPRVIANWSYPGFTRITGSTVPLRSVAFHSSAQQGRPVRAVKYTCTDTHSNSASSTVLNATVDLTMSDSVPIVEYVGAVSTTSLTQGDVLTCNFVAYPWVGDSGSIINTGDGVYSQPTPYYAPQTYLLDKTSPGNLTCAAVVATDGVDASGASVKENVFDSGSPPASYLTIAAAALGIKTCQGATAQGTIYLKTGAYSWAGSSHTIAGTSQSWLEIKPFPGLTKADVSITGYASQGHLGAGTKVKLYDIAINVSSAPTYLFTGFDYMWVDNCSLVANGSATFYEVNARYVTRSLVGDCLTALTHHSSGHNVVLIRGNNLNGYDHPIGAYCFIGNIRTDANTGMNIDQERAATSPVNIMPIIAFNKILNSQLVSVKLIKLFETTNSPLGAVVVQNVLEQSSNDGQALVWMAADSSTGTPVNNALLWHNTIVGQRINRAYNDDGSDRLLRTVWSEKYDIREGEAIKSDTFTTANSARVGNWPVLYGVGRSGMMSPVITTIGANPDFQNEFAGLNGYSPSTTGNPPRSTVQNLIDYLHFVNRSATDAISDGLGNGDYRLKPNSPAIGIVPSEKAVLSYDIAGRPRYNDGNGAAGAYEYIPTGAFTGSMQ